MDEQTIAKIWSAITTVFLIVLLNTDLRTHGSSIFFTGIDVMNVEKYSTAWYGIVISCPLFIVVMAINRMYIKSREIPGKRLVQRIPVPYHLKLDPEKHYGTGFQRVVFSVVYIVPVLLLLDLLSKFLEGTVYQIDQGTAKALTHGKWDHLVTFRSFSSASHLMYKYGDSVKGLYFYPGYESWLIVIFVLTAIIFWALFLLRLFRGR